MSAAFRRAVAVALPPAAGVLAALGSLWLAAALIERPPPAQREQDSVAPVEVEVAAPAVREAPAVEPSEPTAFAPASATELPPLGPLDAAASALSNDPLTHRGWSTASALPGLAASAASAPLGGAPSLVTHVDAAAPQAAAVPPAPDEPAVAQSRPQPRYPEDARRRGIEGFVVVRLRLDARGHVTEATIVESAPPGAFDAQALAAARRYRFQPARRGGHSVASTVDQRILFRLGG